MGTIREALAAIFEDRKELTGLTQAELARRVGCSKSTISALLSGERSLSEDWIEKICAALGVTLRDVGSRGAVRPKHHDLHVKLDAILEGNQDLASGISTNIEAIYQLLLARLSTKSPPKTNTKLSRAKARG